MKLSKLALTVLTASSFLLAGSAMDDQHTLKKKIQAAMTSDIRSSQETARDDNRKPLETLAFFGLKPDMHIVELIPGGGWYTKILAPVVADEGQYYAAIGAGRVADTLLKEPGFEMPVCGVRTGPVSILLMLTHSV